MKPAILLTCVLALYSHALFADTIVATPGPICCGGAIPTLNSPDPGLNSDAVSWTQTSSYTNVSISAVILTFSSAFISSASIDAFLTDGAGVVIASDLDVPIPLNFGPGLETFFSGISLGPDTYYLVLSTPTATEGAIWIDETNGAITLSAGTTFNGSYNAFGGSVTSPLGPSPSLVTPSGTEFLFQVTGTSAPEPGTLGSMIVGALGIAMSIRRKHRAVRPFDC